MWVTHKGLCNVENGLNDQWESNCPWFTRFRCSFFRQIEASLASPVFVPLRHLCEMSRGNPKREVLIILLTEMQIRQPRIGYHLLYFLTVG